MSKFKLKSARFVLLALIALLVTFCLATVLVACDLGDDGSAGENKGPGAIISQEGLTDEQKESLKMFDYYSGAGEVGIRGLKAEYSHVTDLVIPDVATHIQACAFEDCSNLKTVTVNSGMKEIGFNAFNNCRSLEKIVIPNPDTVIEEGILAGCENMRSMTIPVVGTNHDETFIGSIFGVHTAEEMPSTLKEVIITGGHYINTYAFTGCRTIETLSLPASITDINESAFYDFTGLKNIIIANNNPAYSGAGNCIVEKATKTLIYGCENSVIPTDGSVEHIANFAFEGCVGLTEIVVPDSVTDIGIIAFKGCTSLESISVPFLGASRTEPSKIAYLFGTHYYDVPSSLKNVTVTGKVQICAEAFSYCKNLESVTVLDAETVGYSAFSSCSNIKNISITGSATVIGGNAFHGCSALESLVLPDSVTTIAPQAFEACSSLKSLVIPDGVKSLPSPALRDCSSLESLTVPFIGNSFGNLFSSSSKVPATLKDVTITRETVFPSWAFAGCASIERISIPDCIEEIGTKAFEGCTNLQYNTYDNALYLGNDSNPHLALIKATDTDIDSCEIHGDTKVISSSAFKNCNLSNVILSEGLKTIGSYAFEECSSLSEVSIPASVTNLGSGIFMKCRSLARISVANGNSAYRVDKNCLIEIATATVVTSANGCTIPTYIKKIGAYAFSGQTFTDIVIPSGVTEIGTGAFSSCQSLVSVIIPSGVTRIETSAFDGCTALVSVVIPKSVTAIGTSVFAGDSKLKYVYYAGTQSDWENISVSGKNEQYLNAEKLYFYSESEPALNSDGTDYDGNYWHYADEIPVVWIKQN